MHDLYTDENKKCIYFFKLISSKPNSVCGYNVECINKLKKEKRHRKINTQCHIEI